jgi:hypothetical protein
MRVAIERNGQSPFSTTTTVEGNGVIRIRIPCDFEGQAGVLTIEAQGYATVKQEVTVTEDAFPKAIELVPEPVCGTPHPLITGSNLAGEATITAPQGDCVSVQARQIITVSWSGAPPDVTLWVLVYSPQANLYFPHECASGILPEGGRQCSANFGRLEPYEVVVVLADSGAFTALQEIARHGSGVAPAVLPAGIAEKDSLLVVRTE